MVFITAIRLSGGSGHEHISRVQWRNPDNGQTGESSTQEMITWIRQGNTAKVADARGSVEVRVVDAHPPYLRTYADGRWTDNLLALPRF